MKQAAVQWNCGTSHGGVATEARSLALAHAQNLHQALTPLQWQHGDDLELHERLFGHLR